LRALLPFPIACWLILDGAPTLWQFIFFLLLKMQISLSHWWWHYKVVWASWNKTCLPIHGQKFCPYVFHPPGIQGACTVRHDLHPWLHWNQMCDNDGGRFFHFYSEGNITSANLSNLPKVTKVICDRM
jgi:hypothetical protein